MLDTGDFDAVVSDISMPRLNGLQLLRRVREVHDDLPVIMITGAPTLETAIEALEHGAFRYLVKPVDFTELSRVTQQAVQLRRLAIAKREAHAALGSGSVPTTLQASFARVLDTLWPAFQPIIRAADGSTFGYEALLRAEEPSLPHPGAILDAAERLGELPTLFRQMRQRTFEQFAAAPEGMRLFLNLHPLDLHDESLMDITSLAGCCAERVVLEVTERAALEKVADVRRRVANLREVGYQIAIDDLGAGYAGLTSFATLEPEFVKLDMALVRDVDKTPIKQRLVKLMTGLCHDMGMLVVAEGVETEAESNTVVDLGCDLLQGYRFGRPARGLT
jgi:EAL domain-containing protein (putative c-di-GMP-specific phosphodiesterase class I)